MNARIGMAAVVLSLTIKVSASEGPVESPKPAEHTLQQIEGWTVQVDQRLLGGEDAELGRRALALLGNRLFEIKVVVPADKVARLQQIIIWLDRTHGRLTSMQYHPSRGWLEQHGYSTNLAKCVHIPDAARFANPRRHIQQPWAVLHELAHGYHDQVLGFEDAKIKTVWERVVASGAFAKVLHVDGKVIKHYALTNQKEFFAEMTESYFGINDFVPFNRAELRQTAPETFALMQSVWGPLP